VKLWSQFMTDSLGELSSQAAIWERTMTFDRDLSPTAARALLRLRFSTEDEARMRDLGAKARAGALAPDEQRTIDTYERLGCLLDILHSKARQALKQRRHAS
jgi:hypothetical protein